MTAVLLALLTAVTYGLANYLGPLMTRQYPLGGVLLTGQCVGLAGAAGLLAVRGGATPDGRHLLLGGLAGVCNDVGLLAEEYDPVAGRMLGNFPQAFSHAALIAAAARLGEG